MLTILANVAYLLMLFAFITRDILHLRSLLVIAQTVVVIYTWRNGVPVISAWNALYVCINAFMVVQILRERRSVVLPADLVPLYERHFAALSPPEFLRWWHSGTRETMESVRLVRAGERPGALYFVLSGRVQVIREGATVLELPHGYFVAEMSLLTDRPANADVDIVGVAEVMRWDTEGLARVRQRNPALWGKIQAVIGLDLVEKVRRGEVAAPA